MAEHSAHTDTARAARPPLRIALAGVGTVGAGVIRLVETNAGLIARRAGRPIVVSAVCARDRHKDRGVDLSAYANVAAFMGRMAARPAVQEALKAEGLAT